mmetsp:Transcript_48223/g.105228  ORF Transcript_48223/g.105228 Transcript_48223/m.105228 type:complete len:240 (+) Transcript_48223:1556-2275(+)
MRLSRAGPMKDGAADRSSMTGFNTFNHVDPWPIPANKGSRTNGSSLVALMALVVLLGPGLSVFSFFSGASAISGAVSFSGSFRFFSAALFASAFAVALAAAFALALPSGRFLAAALASAFASALAPALRAAAFAAAFAGIAAMALPTASILPSTTRPQVAGEGPERNQVIFTPSLAFLAQAEDLEVFCSMAWNLGNFTALHPFLPFVTASFSPLSSFTSSFPSWIALCAASASASEIVM